MFTLLVGMHFRPPAKLILAELPSGTRLNLVPEPDNPYDAEAVKVIIQTSELKHALESILSQSEEFDRFNLQLAGMGFNVDDLLIEPEWHLGYCARTGNVQLAKIAGASSASEVLDCRAHTGVLFFGANGEPLIRIEP